MSPEPSPHRIAFLTAATSASALLRDPAVHASWEAPSALAGFAVSGLAGHLAQQVVRVPESLKVDHAGNDVAPLLDHYGRAAWIGAALDSETNVGIRARGDELAADGPDALCDRVDQMIGTLRETLATTPEDRRVALPGRSYALTLDDFLTTRMLEIAVHSDDLAVSAGIATPDLPDEVIRPVLDVLAGLAVKRHGQPAVIRALTRAERAPAAINAM